MDSRWRFLHHDMAELRGRVRQVGPGAGKPGPSGVPAGKENPAREEGNRDGDRTESREERRPCVKKSRYCSSRTRTVNRHRWMRRES